MKKSVMKFRFTNLLAIAMVTLFVSACSAGTQTSSPPSADSGAKTSPSKPAGTEQSTEQRGKKKAGGNVVVIIPQDLDYLDPHLAVAAGTAEVLFNVFEGLLKPNEKGELYPAIAESYQVSQDGLTYSFKLRNGVKFHNGNPVTSEDVKFSYERLAGTATGKPLSSAFPAFNRSKLPMRPPLLLS